MACSNAEMKGNKTQIGLKILGDMQGFSMSISVRYAPVAYNSVHNYFSLTSVHPYICVSASCQEGCIGRAGLSP